MLPGKFDHDPIKISWTVVRRSNT